VQPIAIGGIDVAPAISIGVALWPEDGSTPAELVDNAITAAANPAGVGPATFYSPKAREEAQQRFALEQDLRHAIAAKEFELAFQPVVDLIAGKVTGAEALVRWRHREKGLIAPNRFIPLAERTGLINEIGMWVIRQACAQAGEWRQDGMVPLKVAVNVSARQFHDPRLMNVLKDALTDSGIAPEGLEVELTESVAMVDYDHTKRMFASLADLGVSVAIDDFGTGYASLSYLTTLPLDMLKLDRRLIANIVSGERDRTVVRAIIGLARDLGLRVVVEGVESTAQLALLSDWGCDLYQGFLGAGALTEEELGRFVAASHIEAA
jgi:EAL domain-containing protein (putative c-di-GMP-specific phosphodiesterase class I)